MINNFNNKFKDLSNKELKIVVEQYLEYEKTGVIHENELGVFRDFYTEEYGNYWSVVLSQFLLHELALRFMEN